VAAGRYVKHAGVRPCVGQTTQAKQPVASSRGSAIVQAGGGRKRTSTSPGVRPWNHDRPSSNAGVKHPDAARSMLTWRFPAHAGGGEEPDRDGRHHRWSCAALPGRRRMTSGEPRPRNPGAAPERDRTHRTSATKPASAGRLRCGTSREHEPARLCEGGPRGCGVTAGVDRGGFGEGTRGGHDPSIIDRGRPNRRAGDESSGRPCGQREPRHNGAHHQLLILAQQHPGRQMTLPDSGRGSCSEYPACSGARFQDTTPLT